MKFCRRVCCVAPGACNVLYGGPEWGGETDHPGQIIVEVTGSTSIFDPDGSGSAPQAGHCCPCLNGTYYLDHWGGCIWRGQHVFNNDEPVKEECEEPLPCFQMSFPSVCEPVNAGALYIWLSFGVNAGESFANLQVSQFYQRTGRGYVCGGEYNARWSYPGHPPGERWDISDWVTANDESDGFPYSGERFCGWSTWYEIGNGTFFPDLGTAQPPTATFRLKAAS